MASEPWLVRHMGKVIVGILGLSCGLLIALSAAISRQCNADCRSLGTMSAAECSFHCRYRR